MIYVFDLDEEEFDAVYHEIVQTKELLDTAREFEKRRKEFYAKKEKQSIQ